MSGLSPEERNRVINQIHGLVESLREEEGIQIRGCREAAVPLLGIGVLLFLGYVVRNLTGDAQLVVLGIISFIVVMSLVVYFVAR